MATPKSTYANLTKSGYIASDAMVAAIARDYADGVERTDGVRGVYLKILVAHSQKELVGIKRPSADDAKQSVAAAHSRLYSVILETITTPDIAPETDVEPEERRRRTMERNRRSTFARTAKTTLLKWIDAGGKLAQLAPAEVSKEGLRALYAGLPTGTGTLQERIERTETTLERLLKELQAEAPEAVRDTIADLQIRLQAIALPIRQVTRGKKQVGELTLHPH